MKYLKMLGLAAIAAAALMAFVGASSASATELTSPSGTMVTTGTTIESSSEGHAVLDSPIGKIECNSTVSGATGNTGGAEETVSGNISTLSFTGCTTAVVKVLANGSLEIHSISGTSNGTLTSSGAEVTVETFGAHCIYKTTSTDIGTLTGSATTGGNATLDISANIPRTSGRSGALCGSSAPWTGSYKVTSPATLNVD